MTWKKVVCPFLCLLVLCGCSGNSLFTNHPNTQQEIGNPQHELFYEDHYIVNVSYPKIDIEEVDAQVQKEIDNIKEAYLQEVASYQEERKAELNVDYQSYVVDDRYISIKFDVFESIQQNKESILTLVYDNEEKAFVSFDDVFEDGAIDEIAKKAVRYFNVTYPNECNSTNFAVASAPLARNYNLFVLRKDRVVFYFQEGTLFDYSVQYEVAVDEIKDFISFEGEVVATFVPYNDILNEPVKQIDPNQPMVALTFDDGPTPEYTNAILDALKENNASATFFVLGSRASNYPEILQRMILEGNEIGNHTYSHKQLTALSKANIEEEITHTQETIHDATNRYPTVIRPPYGSKNDTVLQSAGNKKIVTWSLDTEDWRSKNAKTIVDKVVNEVEDGSIILMHDLYASSADAAIILISKLREMGYQLVTVSELHAYGKAPIGKIL